MDPRLPQTRRPEAESAAGRDGIAALPAGFLLHRFGSVPSTNDEARRLAQRGAPDRTVVLAEAQTAGRGRYSRQWESPGGNLYVSFLFRPQIPPRNAGQIGYVAAVAVYDTVAEAIGTPAPVACKWPNDVLVGGEKIAGILPESSIGADGALEWIVLGIGLNLVSAPVDAVRPATSLSAHRDAHGDAPPGPERALAALGRALDGWMRRWLDDGFGDVREAWLARTGPIGASLRVVLPDRSIVGRFGGLDRNGALVLDTAAGKQVVHSGEVFSGEAR